MRNAEDDFDFDFEEGIDCQRTREFRDGDTYYPITGMQPTRVDIVEQIFTPEREARVLDHQKRIQKELRKKELKKGKR